MGWDQTSQTKLCMVRIGKCFGKTEEILKEFNENNNIPQQSSQHSHGSSKDDLTKILSQLLDVSQVFQNKPECAHRNFADFRSNQLLTTDSSKLEKNE